MPEELKDVDAFIVSQSSVWITGRLFLAFAYYFVASISKYRLQLPLQLSEKTIYLFVDNHPSKFNSKANGLFAMNNIKFIIFPAH